jgi:hypothetical protein
MTTASAASPLVAVSGSGSASARKSCTSALVALVTV